MQIYRLNGLGTQSFQRRLTNEEQADYKQNALKPAFDYLGTKDVAMIIHGTCYPEGSRDIGTGSPYGKVAAQLIPFEILHGFTSNQLGPVGVIRNPQAPSPYKSTINTKNFLFIDFSKLTGEDYGEILQQDDLDKILLTPENTGENYSYSNFSEAFANYKYLINKARNNLMKSVSGGKLSAVRLYNDYTAFKNEKGKPLYYEALFNVLSDIYHDDDFTKWSDIDKNLVKKLENKEPDALARVKKLSAFAKDDIKDFMFGQFIIEKQIKENTNLRKNAGFKYINDFHIGCSKSDEWANQDVFLKDYRLGCPYGGDNNSPQFWNIPVPDPKKLFNSDGTLGLAGIYLQNRFETALENFDNLRIDHVLGLIDPYIYNIHTKQGKNISQMPEVDPDGNYKKILNKIVLPSLEKHGIDKNSPVWENLGAGTPVFEEVFAQKNDLPGITQLEWMRGEPLMNSQNYALVGSHDSDPANIMIKKDWIRASEAWSPLYLAGTLNSNPERAGFRDEFCQKIANDDLERVKAKFAELFYTHKKVEISFADFFGIDKTYNKGGSENDRNWKLRLNKDYEQDYYDNLSSKHPTALNMPEILKMAVQAKLDNDINRSNPVDEENVENILNALDKYETILKTPETEE